MPHGRRTCLAGRLSRVQVPSLASTQCPVISLRRRRSERSVFGSVCGRERDQPGRSFSRHQRTIEVIQNIGKAALVAEEIRGAVRDEITAGPIEQGDREQFRSVSRAIEDAIDLVGMRPDCGGPLAGNVMSSIADPIVGAR
jgi:hypothetical protein